MQEKIFSLFFLQINKQPKADS